LADPDPARAFNPFGDGSHTAASTLEAIRTEQRNLARSDLRSFSVLADRPLFEPPAGAAKPAHGAARRDGRLRRKLSRGPQSFGRRVAAAFTELSVPLVGDAHSLRTPPRLELALAGRYEQYSDFGGSFNPKAGLRWAPLQWLKLRTSFGTAFK